MDIAGQPKLLLGINIRIRNLNGLPNNIYLSTCSKFIVRLGMEPTLSDKASELVNKGSSEVLRSLHRGWCFRFIDLHLHLQSEERNARLLDQVPEFPDLLV
jgi:hypothetical protein